MVDAYGRACKQVETEDHLIAVQWLKMITDVIGRAKKALLMPRSVASARTVAKASS